MFEKDIENANDVSYMYADLLKKNTKYKVIVVFFDPEP